MNCNEQNPYLIPGKPEPNDPLLVRKDIAKLLTFDVNFHQRRDTRIIIFILFSGESPTSTLGLVAVLIWLFVAFIVTSSYTSSLSSILTLQSTPSGVISSTRESSLIRYLQTAKALEFTLSRISPTISSKIVASELESLNYLLRSRYWHVAI